MIKDKAEEKAREYAESVVDSNVENYIGEEIFNSQIDFISQCYLAGYNSLSTENAQLREALREIVKHTDDMMNARTDLEYNISSVNRTNAIEQAKQLLTDNTQDDEKE